MKQISVSLYPLHRRESGVGLVELMIALVIGLFLVAGVMTMFTNSKRTYLYQQSQGVEDEYQRLAATLFGAILRQTGHTEMDYASALMGKAFVFKTNTTAPFATAVNGQVIIGSSGDSAVVGDDEISYRFMSGVGIFGCDGNPFPTPASVPALRQETLKIVNNVLVCSWGPDADDSMPLIGDTNVSPAQQLLVQSLNISYGVDTDGDDSIDTYQQASEIDTAVAAASTTIDWLKVKSAQIEMTIKSGNRSPVTMKYAVEFPNTIGSL